MILAKLGGSLFDHPRLGPGLRAYLSSLAPTPIQLVPGGGEIVESLRRFDRIHALGEEACHWLAIRAMSVTAGMVTRFIDVPELRNRVYIPDVLAFMQDDEIRSGALPHSWAVTSDSIAARMANVAGAERLVLLKSIDIPAGTSWAEAAAKGWVDAYFPQAVAGAKYSIEVVDFALYLDSFVS